MAHENSRMIDAGLQGVKFDLQLPPKQKLIAQPPADQGIGDAAMFHYTWGTIWKDATGSEVWKFDKRFYTDANFELQVLLALSTYDCLCLGLCACWGRSGFTLPAVTGCAVAVAALAAIAVRQLPAARCAAPRAPRSSVQLLATAAAACRNLEHSKNSVLSRAKAMFRTPWARPQGGGWGAQVPLIPMPPKWDASVTLKQQDSQPVTEQLTRVYESQIVQMNKAIEKLPKLARS